MRLRHFEAKVPHNKFQVARISHFHAQYVERGFKGDDFCPLQNLTEGAQK
jgi:hypothetical protein